MANLIKMDLYRLVRSKLFWILNGVVFVFSAVFTYLGFVFNEMLKSMTEYTPYPTEIKFSELLSSPIDQILLILVMISAVSFMYADIANGYIKNIAGQLTNKGNTVISKFIVAGIHNFTFMFLGLLGQTVSECFIRKIVFDSMVPYGIAAFAIKWLLLMSISSIVLFFSTGLKNKTVASVVGVLLSSGLLGLVYIGLNAGIANIFKTDNFDINSYMPDQLFGQTVAATLNVTAFNAIIVSLVVSGVFLFFTVKIFNNSDVK